MTNITVGLFGTCGTSTWRKQFIEEYQASGINYFNPQLPDGTWKPSDADNEAHHLATDQIILFPVISETYGLGSLSEVGFSILNAIKLNQRRQFVILIDSQVSESLTNPQLVKASNSARALVLAHIKELNFDNVHLVETLPNMLQLSKKLYQIESLKTELSQFELSNASMKGRHV